MAPAKVIPLYTKPRVISDECLMMMLVLWREKHDTVEIAAMLGLPEYEVANRLPALRERFSFTSLRNGNGGGEIGGESELG